MSEEIAQSAADLALVERLTRERDALAIQVKALADQAADLTDDRDHWTLAARRAETALWELRRTIVRMREGGHELPGSLFHASFAWEEEDRGGLDEASGRRR